MQLPDFNPSDFDCRLPLQLRFNDIDRYGHVNNNVYLQFFDLGKWRFFEQKLGADFDKTGLAVVVVNINCDFYAPTFMDETVEVFTRLKSVGNKSLQLEQVIADADGRQKCRAVTVMAGFDPQTLTSAEIPEDVKRRLGL